MTRVVVVGSGIAGLIAALEARSAGADVVVLTKAASDESNTRYAQGGIAAVLSADDSVQAHAEDTLRASSGLADPDAVRALVAGGAGAIASLEARGVGFDRGADGARLLGRAAVPTASRNQHPGGDATGAEIQRGLHAECRERGIEMREGAFVTDVVVSDGRVVGVRMIERGAIAEAQADAVVLATGGIGQAYAVTTNPQVATGDGVAIALRAGAAVRDMEFVQFHPTVLAVGAPFLVSEAVRGEGAVLLDEAGERFALDAHPDGELAPRDVIARAIARAMARQGGRPVLLDATSQGAAFLTRRFPTIDRAVRDRGLDWARVPIPVSPAAHYVMGGVATDLDGRTSVPGLFAAGETARTGVHGANRLASNSLLEGAVFGARAGRAATRESVREGGGGGSTALAPEPRDRLVAETTAHGGVPPFSRRALQDLMWSCSGLSRDAEGLAEAAATIARWRALALAPRTVREHEDRNLLDAAAEIVRAASARTASIGAHWRSDDVPAHEHPKPVLEAAC